METYNYKEAVKNDVKNYIDSNINLSDYSDKDELRDYLRDTLSCEDSVTGNASGSYFCNAYKAEECLCHNLDLFVEACEELDEIADISKGAEHADVTIRCYLLFSAIDEVLEDIVFE